MGSTPPKAVLLLSEAPWDGPRPSSKLRPRLRKEHQVVGEGRDVRFERSGISGYTLIGEKGVLHAAAFAG
jgi:hypothetical protein